jgi:DNA-binding HxlR family transcriptional regulator
MAAQLLGDRWSLLILREAFYGVTRFEDLRADLNAPRAALSQRLETLVEFGILSRVPYREAKSRTRHEYRLTDVGQDLALVLIALMQWGDRHLRDDAPPLKVIEKSTGESLSVALVNTRGRIVHLDDVAQTIAESGGS